MYRLQKLLSMLGLYSRRATEKLILEQRIKINGKIAALGDKWIKGDSLFLDDKELQVNLKLLNVDTQVIKYFKPIGEIVSMNDKFNKNNVFKYLPSVKGKWINIGRLDVQSSGLLLFTNNGDYANELMHPSNVIEREYEVVTDKTINISSQKKLLSGVLIGKDVTGKFKAINLIAKNKYRIILVTGKNREIRKSLQYFNIKTLKLHRCRYGDVKIGRMKPKEIRYVNIKYINNFLIKP